MTLLVPIQDELVLRRTLVKLFHIQKSLATHAEDIRAQNATLADLRKEQRKHEAELEKARQEQAKSRSAVMAKEKRIKKAEKALETKVRACAVPLLHNLPICKFIAA